MEDTLLSVAWENPTRPRLLQQTIWGYPMNLHLIQSGRISNCWFCTGPRVNEFMCEPLKIRISISYSLLSLLEISPIGFQSRCFGGSSFQYRSQSLGTWRGAHTPCSVESSASVSSLLTVGHCPGRRAVGKTVSASPSISVWPFHRLVRGAYQSSITSLSLYSSHFFSSRTLLFGVPGMGHPCSWDTWLFSLSWYNVSISDVGIPDCLGSFRSFPAKSQWNLPWLPNLQFQPSSKMSYPLFFLLSF